MTIELSKEDLKCRLFQQNTKQRDMSGRARTCEGWIGSHPTQIFLGFFTSPFLSRRISYHTSFY